MALEAYVRTVWKSGDIVTATKFNNIENQISNLTKIFITDNEADRWKASKSSWGIIKIADNNNFIFNEDGALNFSNAPVFGQIQVTDTINTVDLVASGDIEATGDVEISGILSVENKFIIAQDNSQQEPTYTTTVNTALIVNNTINVTGTATLGAVTANNITITKATLSNSLSTYNSLDLIPEERMEAYIGSTLSSISITASGDGLTGGGTLAASRTISLQPATTTTLGGIIVGDHLSITNNRLSGAYQVATTSSDGLLSSTDKAALDGLVTSVSGLTTTVNGLSLVATSGSYNDLLNKPEMLVKPGESGAYYLSVYTEAGTDTLTSVWADLPLYPDPPTTDGTYTLQVVVTDGTPVYSWVSENGGE